jgi:hypothetical protein
VPVCKEPWSSPATLGGPLTGLLMLGPQPCIDILQRARRLQAEALQEQQGEQLLEPTLHGECVTRQRREAPLRCILMQQ